MIQRPRKQFEVAGRTLQTSSYTKQTDTDWCVGLGIEAESTAVGDSKTRQLALDFAHGEVLALLRTVR